MSKLVEIITSDNNETRNKSLDSVCTTLTLHELINESKALDEFRRSSNSLYDSVRALFFLYAIHRFHLPYKEDIDKSGLIPFEGYEHMLKRRFEEAIEIFLLIQEKKGPSEGISSGLADAYHQLAFQTLADQVRKSVRSTPGNQWMFRTGHPVDHPLSVRPELTQPDNCAGLFPVLHESTPVRMDITHSGWSDIFFLGMDFPQGAQVLNVSVDLAVKNGSKNTPKPPIETYFRVTDNVGIRLTSIDLNTSTFITRLEDIFDFAKDYLGLLKAALIASGMVPPGMEGANIPLSDLLSRLVGEGKGIELVSKVNNIPKGSRLAVSTNLLASLITICMRATRQTKNLTGALLEEERRLVAARAILGEWLGGSGGGWQDSGGVWPGIKLIKGVEASQGDPEFNISKGRLLPQHTILEQEDVSKETRAMLQNCLVMVHGGMAQDVGPILEMVTEKYLLRSEKEWVARQEAISYFDKVVEQLRNGDIKEVGAFTQQNFEGPIQTIIPWTNNIYTDTLIKRTRNEFGTDFWGFWMMGGMSGGGMGFIFDPKVKVKAQERLQDIMLETKEKLKNAVPFAMNPVVYDFKINETGTHCQIMEAQNATLPLEYYTLTAPELLKSDIQSLTNNQRNELEWLGKNAKSSEEYKNFIPQLFDRMLPKSGKDEDGILSLETLLEKYGFDKELHEQIKSDLKSGRIGIAQNRLPVSSTIDDVSAKDLFDATTNIDSEYINIGTEALKNNEIAVLTLAGGVGSRWTKGAGVVKSLNPFVKFGNQHRNFIEIHLAKSRKSSLNPKHQLPHIFTTSYLTHKAIGEYLEVENNFNYKGKLYLSPGQVVGLRIIPTEHDLRYMWEEMPQQILDEQAQKVKESLQNALINWAKTEGEATNYTDNLPHQCIHPVGHWFEIPNLLLNGTLRNLLEEFPTIKHLMVHNIDTLGANVDPALLGYHIKCGSAFTAEVINRKIEDRGGGLAKINGRLRLIEGLALPDEKIEFNLTYYNTNTSWINIEQLLACFKLSREDLTNTHKVKKAIWDMSKRIPTYITIKDVKKRWGKGQEDIFPITQWEKLWGDMTTIPELNCNYVVVPRLRGQQLKEPAQLDGWLRDGSADYINSICDWGESKN
ncbi:MAG: UTP--glucose-1-phosphate uridylyltransferase [Bacteroidales bacterium]|nr:UTP--glucose-1-phosphate uridylyltransferase [Bacteroidales bacterium]